MLQKSTLLFALTLLILLPLMSMSRRLLLAITSLWTVAMAAFKHSAVAFSIAVVAVVVAAVVVVVAAAFV